MTFIAQNEHMQLTKKSSLGVKRLLIVSIIILTPYGCKTRETPTSPKADLATRIIMGNGSQYPAKNVNATRLAESIQARRQFGWDVIARVFSAVTVEGTPIPIWQTWYDGEEFESIFSDFYCNSLSASERKASNPVATDRVNELLHNHAGKAYQDLLTRLGSEATLNRFLEQTKERDLRALNGVSGKAQTLFNGALIGHYLRNFYLVSQCNAENGAVLPGADKTTPCFSEPFPIDAVAIKATWQSAEQSIARYKTDPPAIERNFIANKWIADSIIQPDAEDYPQSNQIYSASLKRPGGLTVRYVLTGMHIMTKETPHWTWTSLWWAGNDGGDFAEGRPSDMGTFQQILENYKACVITDFREQDPNLKNAEIFVTPSLRSIATAVSRINADERIDSGFCSNPYIEFAEGYFNTNCVGCHQHSGSSITADDTSLSFSKLQERETFPADYLWSFSNQVGAQKKDDFRGRMRRVIANVTQTMAAGSHTCKE